MFIRPIQATCLADFQISLQGTPRFDNPSPPFSCKKKKAARIFPRALPKIRIGLLLTGWGEGQGEVLPFK